MLSCDKQITLQDLGKKKKKKWSENRYFQIQWIWAYSSGLFNSMSLCLSPVAKQGWLSSITSRPGSWFSRAYSRTSRVCAAWQDAPPTLPVLCQGPPVIVSGGLASPGLRSMRGMDLTHLTRSRHHRRPIWNPPSCQSPWVFSTVQSNKKIYWINMDLKGLLTPGLLQILQQVDFPLVLYLPTSIWWFPTYKELNQNVTPKKIPELCGV